jgi:hypothetical protein
MAVALRCFAYMQISVNLKRKWSSEWLTASRVPWDNEQPRTSLGIDAAFVVLDYCNIKVVVTVEYNGRGYFYEQKLCTNK